MLPAAASSAELVLQDAVCGFHCHHAFPQHAVKSTAWQSMRLSPGHRSYLQSPLFHVQGDPWYQFAWRLDVAGSVLLLLGAAIYNTSCVSHVWKVRRLVCRHRRDAAPHVLQHWASSAALLDLCELWHPAAGYAVPCWPTITHKPQAACRTCACSPAAHVLPCWLTHAHAALQDYHGEWPLHWPDAEWWLVWLPNTSGG